MVKAARVTSLVAACAALGALAGVAAASPASPASAALDPRYPFSHAEHVARDPASTCVDCHDARATVDGAPTRRAERCARCHDDVPLVAPRDRTDELAIQFKHAPHAAHDCKACHSPAAGDVDERRAEHTTTVTSASCFGCHAQSGATLTEQACSACHGRNERRVAPASHEAAWKREHGKSVMAFAPSNHGTSCTLCHKESSCKSCHRVERPVDHNAVWGERMHGVRASFDRQRCQTCHETGQCIGCHRATEPRNHRGAWKATHGLVARTKSDTSCQTCHRARFCIDCHRGAR